MINQVETQGCPQEKTYLMIIMTHHHWAADCVVVIHNRNHINQGETIHNPQGDIHMTHGITFCWGDPD
jgi:hypothetical protein